MLISHFEPSQPLGGAKTGDPTENTPDHTLAKLGWSHMCPYGDLNPQQWKGVYFDVRVSIIGTVLRK